QTQPAALVEGDTPAILVRPGPPTALHQPGEAEVNVGRYVGAHAEQLTHALYPSHLGGTCSPRRPGTATAAVRFCWGSERMGTHHRPRHPGAVHATYVCLHRPLARDAGGYGARWASGSRPAAHRVQTLSARRGPGPPRPARHWCLP